MCGGRVGGWRASINGRCGHASSRGPTEVIAASAVGIAVLGATAGSMTPQLFG